VRVKSAPRQRTRTRLSPADRRAQIVDIAAHHLNTRPFAAFDISSVAREAGITQGLVYHYFPTKESLIITALEVRAKELLQHCICNEDRPITEKVETGVKGYLNFVEQHEIGYRNIFQEPAAAESEVVRICEQVRAAIIDCFLLTLQTPEKPFLVTRVALRGYVGYAESAILAWIDEKTISREVVERLLYSAIGMAFFEGLRNDPDCPFEVQHVNAIESAYRKYFQLT
jgi:AcrR family transcriptional regulator